MFRPILVFIRARMKYSDRITQYIDTIGPFTGVRDNQGT